MIITKPGQYKTLKDISTRTAISIAHIPAGTIITIKQVSERTNKVIGPPLLDWHHWNMPVEPIEEIKPEEG